MKWAILGLGLVLVTPLLALSAINVEATSPASSITDPASAVLSNPAIHLRSEARRDIEAGLVDSNLLRVLLAIAEHHELAGVGPFVTGHSLYVKGTHRVSLHVYGRAVDIAVVDGNQVSPSNLGALEVVREVLSLPPPLLPQEVGSPWRIPTPGVSVFSNRDHMDHIHLSVKP